MAIAQVETPFGVLGIATSTRGVVEVNLGGPIPLDDAAALSDDDRLAAQSLADEAAKQFREYFKGERTDFELPLDCALFEENSFRARALTALMEVGYGERVSYGELAKMAGSPRAARAAGTACSTNPLAIIIPCHRVVPASGGIGSYGGGETLKKWLLELEQAQ